MVDLLEEASRLHSFLESHQCRFCFIGGIAVQWWGEPRLTRDVDVSLLAGFGREAPYIDLMLGAYAPRIAGAREFALQQRVLLLRGSTGIGIDISLAALPYEAESMERSVLAEMLPGLHLRLCSAEDLVIMKFFAGRDTDHRDARSVLVRQGRDHLNWPLIEASLTSLATLTDDSNLVERARRVRDSVWNP